MSGEIFCTHVTKSTALERPIGVRIASTMTTCSIVTLKPFSGRQPDGLAQPEDSTVVMTRFITQTFRHFIQRAEVRYCCAISRYFALPRVSSQRNRRRGTEGSPGRRPAPYPLPPSGDNAFLQTAHHFVDHRDHLRAIISSSLKSRFGWLTSASGLQRRRLLLSSAYLCCLLYKPETEAVLLTKAVGIKQRVDASR